MTMSLSAGEGGSCTVEIRGMDACLITGRGESRESSIGSGSYLVEVASIVLIEPGMVWS